MRIPSPISKTTNGNLIRGTHSLKKGVKAAMVNTSSNDMRSGSDMVVYGQHWPLRSLGSLLGPLTGRPRWIPSR
jgi:hypothetical protein